MIMWLYSVQGLLILTLIGLVIGAVVAYFTSRKPAQSASTPKGGFKMQSGLLAGVVAGLVAGILSTVPSISIDLSVIFSYASDIVSMMMPIVGVGAGISFGFALVAYIIRLFRQVF
jgi:hypothetical protein